MNVRKAIKRIGALAAGTTMVTATIMGAMAYDLSDYPAPFVENGVFQGKIVIGQEAQVSDVFGAIDIAASLQAAAKSAVEVGSTPGTVSVAGGVEIQSGSNDLNLHDQLDDFNSGKYDNDDFPDLLADGTVEDDDGTDYDYDQDIYVGDANLTFGQDDDYGDLPVWYVDLGGASMKNINFSVTFDTSVDVTALTDSEAITMFGKKYTFDPNHDVGDDMTLYGSDQTVIISQDDPVTVTVDGEEFTIEVLGGNSDDSTAIIRVTGPSGTDTKTLAQGNSRSIANLDLFVDDVFISNIGAQTISVSLFVGSNKIVIPAAGISTTSSYQEIEVDGEDNTDIFAWVDGALNATDGIHFSIDPTDFTNPDTDNKWDWLALGSTWTDPLFGFSLHFDSMTPDAMEGRTLFELSRSGDEYKFNFVNNDGDSFSLPFYQSPSTSLKLADDVVLNATTLLQDDNIFILNEDSTTPKDAVTKIYEVRDIDNTNQKVTLREKGSGATKDYDVNDQIDDTGVTINLVNATHFNLSANVDNWLVFDGGANLSLDRTVSASDSLQLVFYEDVDDMDEQGAATMTFNITDDTNDDIGLTAVSFSNGAAATDDNGDVRYGSSLYGTYFVEERENTGDYLRIYYSETETDYHVFLEGPDAVVSTSGSSSSGTYYQLNDLVVGQIAVYDSDATGMLGTTPLIVVGGPCVNTVAMTLMGNPAECTEGFTMGRGKIKFFSSQNALLVAGYSGDDTVGASYVLADSASYALSGDEVEVIVTDLSHLQVQSVE